MKKVAEMLPLVTIAIALIIIGVTGCEHPEKLWDESLTLIGASLSCIVGLSLVTWVYVKSKN